MRFVRVAHACGRSGVRGARRAGGAASRIKDLASVEGVRQNQLIGYGLVVGLNGTGDTLNNIAVHQAVAAGDARAPRRQHPRPDAAHRQRRRRDGDGEPAGLRHPGHPHRRHRLGDGRREEPAGRHAAGHAAARRRRQCLRGRPGLARDRRLRGRRRRRQGHARRADGRAHLERRDHRARDRLRARPACRNLRLALRNPDFTTAQAHRGRRSTTIIGTPTAEPLDPSTVQLSHPAAVRRQGGRRC